MVQIGNMHTKPTAIAWFSMLLLFHHCSYSIWNILSHLQLALSINTTKNLYAKATSINFAQYLDWINYDTIAMVGADNMVYIIYNAEMRIDNGIAKQYLINFF
jgi:hypothetical protein